MSIAKASATEAWIRARDGYLKIADISLEEKKQLMNSHYEDVASDLSDIETKHAEGSKVRRVLAQLGPFFDGLEAVGQALDVFVNADTHGVLSLVWGSLRVALMVSHLDLLIITVHVWSSTGNSLRANIERLSKLWLNF